MSVSISVVMPAYNEEACIAEVVKIWSDFIDTQVNTFGEGKLIVVNDGSKDNTGAILDAIQPQFPNLIVVHQRNGGHGKAVVNAYKKAVEIGSEWIFQTDSDDQFISEDVIKLWEKRNESDFVLGYRQVRHDAPFRLFVTRVLQMTLFVVYGTWIADANIPFRLIKGTYLKNLLEQLPENTPFAPNIFLAVMSKKAGQKTFDIPITHKERLTGEVSIQKMKLLKVCWQSFQELLQFRLQLNNIVRVLKHQ